MLVDRIQAAVHEVERAQDEIAELERGAARVRPIVAALVDHLDGTWELREQLERARALLREPA